MQGQSVVLYPMLPRKPNRKHSPRTLPIVVGTAVDKQCTGCKEIKSVEQFGTRKHKLSPLGVYDSWCRACADFGRRDAYERLAADPIKCWLSHALYGSRYRSNTDGYPHTLTRADIRWLLQTPVCTYCKIDLTFKSKIGPSATSATLDKVIPKSGYVPGNVVLSCHHCNSIKHDASVQEILMIAEALRKLLAEGVPTPPKTTGCEVFQQKKKWPTEADQPAVDNRPRRSKGSRSETW